MGWINLPHASITKLLQRRFDDVLTIIENDVAKAEIPIAKLISQACTNTSMSQEFKSDISTSEDISSAFDWIRAHSKWFQIDLLKQLTNLPRLKHTKCKQTVIDYETKLKVYFKQRTMPISGSKGEKALIVFIDDAWDKESFIETNCERTCKQIVRILDRVPEEIVGSLHGKILHIITK